MADEKDKFYLLKELFKVVPSGKCRISWHNGEVVHFEGLETEAKVDKEDLEKINNE